MRYVVGYVPNDRGKEAVNLAATLAASRGAHLDVVVVLPAAGRTFSAHPLVDRPYNERLGEQGREWLDQALDGVPDGVSAATRLRFGESSAEGLIDAALDPELGEEAALIVIGASHRGLRGRFTIGTIASSLLHSSPVPVALAPAGYAPKPQITRLTCATGTRAGAEALVDVAVDTASDRRIPLRLMSLVALDVAEPHVEQRAHIDTAELHASDLVEQAKKDMPKDCPVTSAVGRGSTVEACVEQLDFDEQEIVLVGSSRLAGPRRLFIGSSAMKMLRALPVPMIVVPRDYRTRNDGSASPIKERT